MFLAIMNNKRLSFKRKVVNFIDYKLKIYKITKSYKRRYNGYLKRGFERKIKLTQTQKSIYKEYWRALNSNVETDTVEICLNISGVFDKRIIPENIFAVDIERTLLSKRDAFFLANKSIYNKWFISSNFPYIYLHKIENVFYSDDFKMVRKGGELNSILNSIHYPVIIKPNIDTSGGANVNVCYNQTDLLRFLNKSNNLIIQELIKQNIFFEKIAPKSFNTVRVVLYKSVENNEWTVLHCTLRMGVDGGFDNEAIGGIFCGIDSEGNLNNYAVNKYGEIFNKHPNSDFKFVGQLPLYEDLCQKSILIAEQLLYVRIVSLDMILDEDMLWRPIEVNLKYASIRFSQYIGKPFFGDYTDEVLRYCKSNHWTLR